METQSKYSSGVRNLRSIWLIIMGMGADSQSHPIDKSNINWIEGLNHAVIFGIEFFRQQEVSISCSDKKVKLVAGSKGQERLTNIVQCNRGSFSVHE